MGSGGSRQKRKGGSDGGSGKGKQSPKILSGHTGSINCMDISPSGSYLLTGSDDRTARVWDLVTYESKVVLEGHSGYISCCKIWQERFALTGSVDRTIRKWNMLSGNCVSTMEKHNGLINRLLPCGSYLFSASYDQTVICWNLSGGKDVARVFRGHHNSISTMLYVKTSDHDPRGTEDVERNKDAIITGSVDSTARLWSINSGASLRTFKGHKGAILCLTLDRDKKYLYTGSTDCSIKKWNLANGNHLKTFKHHKGSVICLEINHKLLYSASVDCTARCCVAEFGDTFREYSGHEHMISDMKYHNGLLLTSSGHMVRVFDAKSGTLKRTFKDHKYAVNCILVVDNIVFSASYDGTVRLGNIQDLIREKLKSIEGDESSSSLTSLAPSLTAERTVGSDISLRNNSAHEDIRMSTFRTEIEGERVSNRIGHSNRHKRRGAKSTSNRIAPVGAQNHNNNNNNSSEDLLEDILYEEENGGYATRSNSHRSYHDAMETVNEEAEEVSLHNGSRLSSHGKRTNASALPLSRSSTKASLFSNAELTPNRITRSSSYANEGDLQLHSASTYSRTTTGSVSISLPSSTNSSRPVTHTSKNGHTRESSDVSRKRAKTEDSLKSGENTSRMSPADLALVDEEMRMIAVETDSTSTGYHSDKSSPQSLNENEKKTQLPLIGKRTVPKSRLKSKVPSPVVEYATPRRVNSKPSVWTPCTNSVEIPSNKGRKLAARGGSIKRTTGNSAAVGRKDTLTQNERERLENEILKMS